MGVVATFLFTIGAPSTMKWPVAPESDMVYSTALVRRLVSKIMCACGDVRKLRPRMIAFHAACRVGIANGVVPIICVASFVGIDNSFGISFSIFRDGLERSLDRLDMVTVASSSSPLYSISVYGIPRSTGTQFWVGFKWDSSHVIVLFNILNLLSSLAPNRQACPSCGLVGSCVL